MRRRGPAWGGQGPGREAATAHPVPCHDLPLAGPLRTREARKGSSGLRGAPPSRKRTGEKQHRPGHYTPESSEVGAEGNRSSEGPAKTLRRQKGRDRSRRHAPRPTRAAPRQPDVQRPDPAVVPGQGQLGARRGCPPPLASCAPRPQRGTHPAPPGANSRRLPRRQQRRGRRTPGVSAEPSPGPFALLPRGASSWAPAGSAARAPAGGPRSWAWRAEPRPALDPPLRPHPPRVGPASALPLPCLCPPSPGLRLPRPGPCLSPQRQLSF